MTPRSPYANCTDAYSYVPDVVERVPARRVEPIPPGSLVVDWFVMFMAPFGWCEYRAPWGELCRARMKVDDQPLPPPEKISEEHWPMKHCEGWPP